MASPSRLKRLRKFVQADVNALPDRTVPRRPAAETDLDDSGGVSIGITEPSKHSTVNNLKPPSIITPIEISTESPYVSVKESASSHNTRTTQLSMTTPNAATPLAATDLQQGEAVSGCFTPFRAVSKYPYNFCKKSVSKDIASAFFDQGKFWKREWDLYYIWDVEPTKPLILVRECQFQDLLEEINSHLKLDLAITDSQREEGLVSRFPDHPDCLPRYLGRCNSREQYDTMVNNTPDHKFRIMGERARAPPDTGTLDQFKQLMEELWGIQRAKSKAKQEQRLQERLTKQMSMVDQLKRAQRYLGLRLSEPMAFGIQQAIDASLPAPFAFDKSVVFVCVDVESYERAHHKITEVGIATLDTRDLLGVAPGQDGEHWRKKIKARHFRIREHRHLVNSQFVAGHPDGFEFGESTFVTLRDAPARVAACFRPPFGVHASNTAIKEINNMLNQTNFSENRTIVFLGHDTLGDIRYLQQLGYDPMKVENIIEAMDTAKMYQAWRREQNQASLGKIMFDFDIVAWKLHNAGNDAMYTVQAMLAICVREATIRGSSELKTMRENEKIERLAAAYNAAEKQAMEAAEGWSDHEANGDGGVPIPLE
ncbi:hypothetical protein GQ44DRAFT_624633 [Phaeosphaeriaceae sp. PMI808]|nr:hypothetical protein GQ44DRAFT_624633 [Phaeosphaeriaceae sp. PMI808]